MQPDQLQQPTTKETPTTERDLRLLRGGADEVPTLELAFPELRPEAMYGLAGDIVRAIEPHSEADPTALLTTTLAAFGALVGSGPHAMADGAEHPARIWPLIVGRTAKARKGTSWAQVRRVLAGADSKFANDRVLAGFGSGESLVDAVAGDQDRRLLVVEPEYARTLAVMKREGSILGQLMRQAWDGSRLQVRSRSGTAVADGAHIVVVAHITGDELLARLAESDALGGSLNRFIIVPARRSKLLPNGGNLDDGDLDDFVRKFALFARQVRTAGIVRRDPQAEDYWAQLYAGLAEDEPAGLLGAVVARDSAQILRLSVTFALLDGVNRISVQHIKAAQAIWDYSRAGAAMLFGTKTGDPIADQIYSALQEQSGLALDGRDIHKLLGRHARADRIDQAIAVLEKRGLANKANKATHGRPRMSLTLANKANEANKVTDDPPPPDDSSDPALDHYDDGEPA